MKKIVLFIVPVMIALAFSACSNKVYTGKPAEAAAINPTDYVPFSKDLKFRLEHDHADIRKVQFYLDKPIILRHMSPSASGAIKQGMITYDNVQDVQEINIPAYTPGVCERVRGDSLYISFDAPQNAFVFAAIYSNEHFMLQGTNWYNGVTDVTYDGKIYKAYCDGCGSAGEASLLIKKSQAGNNAGGAPGGGKTLAGRKLN
jgi:hypothetical protein